MSSAGKTSVWKGKKEKKRQTAELGVLAALVAERCERADKLGELDLLVLVLVKDAQQPSEQRVLAQLGDGLELVRRQRPAPVAVQLLEAPVQPPQLVLGDCGVPPCRAPCECVCGNGGKRRNGVWGVCSQLVAFIMASMSSCFRPDTLCPISVVCVCVFLRDNNDAKWWGGKNERKKKEKKRQSVKKKGTEKREKKKKRKKKGAKERVEWR